MRLNIKLVAFTILLFVEYNLLGVWLDIRGLVTTPSLWFVFLAIALAVVMAILLKSAIKDCLMDILNRKGDGCEKVD